MNARLHWFYRFSILALSFDLGIALLAMFVPDFLQAILGPGVTEFSYIWLAYAGLLLVQLALFSLPAARRPLAHTGFAWLTVLARALFGLFWAGQIVRWDLQGAIRGLFLIEILLALILFVLLQAGLEAKDRLKGLNAWAILKATWLGQKDKVYLTWFSRLILLAAGVNALFFVPAIFFPELLASQLFSTAVKYNYVWIANAGFLLFLLSLFYIAVAYKPLAHSHYAWLLCITQLMAAVFWLWQDAQWSPLGKVSWFFLPSLLFALGMFVLLQLGLPEAHKVHPATIRKTVTNLFRHVRAALGSPWGLGFAVAVIALGGSSFLYLHMHLVKKTSDTVFDSAEEHFKYGAIGLSMSSRIPLYLFEVMPQMCSELLPSYARGGSAKHAYRSLGILYEQGKDLPIGFAKRKIGYPSLEPNCALCHSGSYRKTSLEQDQFIPGAPAHELDLESFQWFLYDCAASSGFSSKAALELIEKNHDLSWPLKQLYRYIIIPFAKTSLAQQQQDYSWQKTRPRQGRGRTDTFNPTKFTVFYMPDDGTIGTVDYPAIWNQRARKGLWLHWDGNNDNIHERNYAAAMAVGATPYSVIESNFQRVTDYVLSLPPPSYPYEIDQALTKEGWQLFSQHCAECHALGSEKVGTVTPIEEIGTDPHRLNSFSADLVTKFHSIREGLFVFNAYRKTQGYSNLPIDGTWARAPYLHNGSVPNLWELLQDPTQRSKTFYKGYNVYNPSKMGFITGGEEAEKMGFFFDTSVAGNSNQGHNYATNLQDGQKRALMEFLKDY